MLKLKENHRSFEGFQKVYEHESLVNNSTMRFALYEPDDSQNRPILFFLSGLTCTEQNFIQKSGFQQYASDNKIVVICPDTSPRGKSIPISDNWKLGQGASFYVNAEKKPWSENFQMYDYITKELPELISKEFKYSSSIAGIFGHSMGGCGAIQCALKNQNYFKSLSAISPICSLKKSDLSKIAIQNYFEKNSKSIANYDPLSLIEKNNFFYDDILIDVGLEDEFLKQLYIEEFYTNYLESNNKITLRQHKNFGHNYFFVHTFVKDHINFHLKKLENFF